MEKVKRGSVARQGRKVVKKFQDAVSQTSKTLTFTGNALELKIN